MGFDKKRFDTDVKEEFCCPICHDVLEDPIAINNCDHVFCSECIKNWLQHPKHKFCPMDREPTDLEQLRSPFRLFINLLFELKIRCEYEECNKFVQMSELNAHLQECPYNPSNKEKEIDCPKNCGTRIKLNENHDCIESMKKIIETLEQKLKKYQKELNEEKSNIEKIKKKFEKEIKDKDEKINLLKQEIETKNSIIEFSSDSKQSRKSLQYTLPRLKKNSNQTIPPLIEFSNEQSLQQMPSCSQPSSPTFNEQQQNQTSSSSSSSNITNSKFYDKPTMMRSSSSSSPPKEQSFFPTNKNINNINMKESRVKSNVTFFNRMFNQNSNNENNHNDNNLLNNNELITNNNNKHNNNNNNLDHFMDRCIRINIKQNVLSKVNRRHFYANVNDDNKIVVIKKNVHSFTLDYETKLLEYIAPLIRFDSRVLDIGSGTSFLTCCLAQMSGFVVGVEIVPELVAKSLEIIQNHYRELQLCIVKSDGRFGCEKYAPYDLILIEPMIRTNIPDKLFGQLTPNGHIIAVINESKQSIKMILMNSQRQVIKVLNNDRNWLNENNKDYLIDPQNPETRSRNLMNIIYNKN